MSSNRIQDIDAVAQGVAKYLAEHVEGAVKRSLHEAVKTCCNCVHFKPNEGEVCVLYKLRPPAHVIAFGCPDFIDAFEVPF